MNFKEMTDEQLIEEIEYVLECHLLLDYVEEKYELFTELLNRFRNKQHSFI